MKRTVVILVGVVAAILAWWGGSRLVGGADQPAARGEADARTSDDLVEMIRDLQARSGTAPWTAPPRLDGAVTVAGTVIDADSGDGVAGAEVVFRSDAGEETTTTGADGAYWIDLPIGTYRAFVRGATVLSVAQPSEGELPGPAAGLPDEGLAPVIVADADLAGVDLTVMRGGTLRGRVVDRAGRAVANAVVRARPDDGNRAALGIDAVESGADGTFEMRLPAGSYGLDVRHPLFVGSAGDRPELTLAAGEVQSKTFTLIAGCVIAGRVVRADGTPSGEGAIERHWDSTGLVKFAQTARIAGDGTFRWTTTEETAVVLRAWPWKSHPSDAQSFDCREGARYEQVVFALPDRGPDFEGEIVDPTGAPVANAYIDVFGLNPLLDQRELTDAEGRWSLFALPPGPYRINAHAPGRGIASVEVTAPGEWIQIQLGATGRIEGTAAAVGNGSFELELTACADGSSYVPLSAGRRLITVTDGRFTIEDVPACRLQVTASWRGQYTRGEVAVPAGGTGRLELALPEGAVQLCLADGHDRRE